MYRVQVELVKVCHVLYGTGTCTHVCTHSTWYMYAVNVVVLRLPAWFAKVWWISVATLYCVVQVTRVSTRVHKSCFYKCVFSRGLFILGSF